MRKTNAVPLILAIFLILAALIVFFTVGLVPTRDHSTYKRYTAAIPYEFDMETLPALTEAINGVSGTPVDVNVVSNILSGKSALEITTIPAADIDESAIILMLGKDFEEMKIESFSSGIYTPAFSGRDLLTLLSVFLFAVIAVYIMAAFAVEGKQTLVVLAAMLCNTLLVLALYVLCRIPSIRFLIAGLLVVWVSTPVLVISRMKNLNESLRSFKRSETDAAMKMSRLETAPRYLDGLIVTALFCGAFAVVGLVLNVPMLSYYGVMLFVAVMVAIYNAALITPLLWKSTIK